MNNNQRYPGWSNIQVGFGDQVIGMVGCTISVIGDVLGLNPIEVNNALKAVNGFSDGKNLGRGNLVAWDKLAEAFPGVTVRRVWAYNNDDVLANIPNVIVEVPALPIGGRGSHWVRYIGNHQLQDPWTGAIRPTSDFPNPTGYCVIIPANQVSTPPVVSTPSPEVTASSKYDFGDPYGVLEMQAVKSQLLAKDQTIVEKTKQITDMTTAIDDLQETEKKLQEQIDALPTTPSGFSFWDWLFSPSKPKTP